MFKTSDLNNRPAGPGKTTQVGIRCFKCAGPYHEATGHRFALVDVVYCGPCYRHVQEWAGRHMRPQVRHKRPFDFYGAAYTSIRAGGGNCPACQGPTQDAHLCDLCEQENAFQQQIDAAMAIEAAAIRADEQIRKGGNN